MEGLNATVGWYLADMYIRMMAWARRWQSEVPGHSGEAGLAASLCPEPASQSAGPQRSQAHPGSRGVGFVAWLCLFFLDERWNMCAIWPRRRLVAESRQNVFDDRQV